MNKIIEHIERQYDIDEQTIQTAIAWDDDKSCEVSLLLSNHSLYVYRNIAFNSEVRYILISDIKSIQYRNKKYILNLRTKEYMTLLPIKDSASCFKKLIDILIIHDTPFIDVDSTKKKTMSIFNKLLILLIIIVISSLSVFCYRHIIREISGPTAEEQRLQREAAKKNKESYIKKATQQKGFNENFLIRLNVYRDYLVKINDNLEKIDISDKDFDWDNLTEKLNDRTSEFMQIKIQNDDMVDYGIHINKKKDYLRDETSKINSDIESLITEIQHHTSTRFEDITSLISLKNQCADIIRHIDVFIKDIENEIVLIEQSISDN